MAYIVFNKNNKRGGKIVKITPLKFLLTALLCCSTVFLTALFAVNFPSLLSSIRFLKINGIAQAQTNEIAKFVLESPRGAVDEKLEILVDEFVRVRSYEKSIQSKVSVLDTLIQNVLGPDHTLLDDVEESEVKDSNHKHVEKGVGGGSWSDLITIKSRSSEQALKSTILSTEDTVSILERSIQKLENIPMGSPVDGRLTSGFGRRKSPFKKKWQNHKGIDIAVARRTPITATANGTVIKAGYSGGYGRIVKIDHGNGLQTVFGHLQKVMVKEGQKVCRGQQIGQVGSSGKSTGPHLHYEVRVDGIPKNPQKFIDLAQAIQLAGL